MACGCGGKKTTDGAPVTLRCIDPNGCTFLPWGFRANGEAYPAMAACTARLLLETFPARLEIAADKPAAIVTDKE